MGLFDSLFRGRAAPLRRPASGFDASPDSALSETPEDRGAQRRELVHVVLRDTMRAHAVPSDWMVALVLPLATGGGRAGFHILLVVRQGHPQMLSHVPAFQESFLAGLRRFDSAANEWMSGLSWQFEGLVATAGGPLPMPPAAAAEPALAAGSAKAPRDVAEEEALQEDLRALLAIQHASLEATRSPQRQPDFEPTQPLR